MAKEHAALRAEKAHEPGARGHMLVDLAALALALHRTLVSRGGDPAAARSLAAAIVRSVVESMLRIPELIADSGAHDSPPRFSRLVAQLDWLTGNFESYVVEAVDGADDVLAFDVVRCPVADYLCAHASWELCAEVFCNLDYQLADRWGVVLERSRTLAWGGPRCDFRWKARGSLPLLSRRSDPPTDALKVGYGCTECVLL